MSNPNPTPAPTTLLWAHEIRRENIHLVNQLDTTKASLASTTSSLETLQNTVSSLEATVQKLSTPANANAAATGGGGSGSESGSEINVTDELEGRIRDLEGCLNARFDDVVRRTEGVERENGTESGRLREEIEVVKSELERSIEERWKKMEDGLREEVRCFVRNVVAKEMEGLRCRKKLTLDEPPKEPEPELVPDSMPTAQTLPLQKNENESPLQTLSQSTLGTPWSTSSDVGNQTNTHDNHNHPEYKHFDRDPDTEMEEYSMIRQNGKSLVEYFTFAETTRSQLPPRKQEGRIVEVFLGGLGDAEMRGHLEKRLDGHGWTWNVLGMLVKDIVTGQSSNMGQQTEKGLGTNGGQKRDMVDDEKAVKRKIKKRRCIPIVPVDEEDFV